jgi:hypothetical protein
LGGKFSFGHVFVENAISGFDLFHFFGLFHFVSPIGKGRAAPAAPHTAGV